MALAAATRSRPIPGAVATLGVSQRVAFLRRTYAHLGVALLFWALLSAAILNYATTFSVEMTVWATQGRFNWFLLMFGFMATGWIAQRMAASDTSRALQYAGLALGAAAYAVILQPFLWAAIVNTQGDAASFHKLIGSAALVTALIFVGLTLTVFISKKDFSMLRGALVVGVFAANGIILASLIFGFTLGIVFTAAVIVLLAGYILYQTSLVASQFPPTHHVAAALMLFSTVATLFIYVLDLLMRLNRR